MNIIQKVGEYRTGSWFQRSQKDIKVITVHHSAIPQGTYRDDEALLKAIQRTHEDKGWPGLSYHFVITESGAIYQTNNFTDITWHDTKNSDSIGVLVDGYFHKPNLDVPTEAQLKSLKELLDWLCTQNPQFPADQNDVVGHRERSATACLPLDRTEILTVGGFKPLSDVGLDDKVAQYDGINISFANPTHVVAPYETVVYCNGPVEQTGNHQTLRYTSKNNLIKEEWKDSLKIRDILIPTAGYHNGSGVDLSPEEIRFLVAVQADGHYERDTRVTRVKNGKEYNSTPYEIGITFHLKKQRKIERLVDILEQNGMRYSIRDKRSGAKYITVGHGTNEKNKEWCERYLNSKCFSEKFLRMSAEQAQVFIEELKYWDGRSTENYPNFVTSLEKNADIVQAVGVLNGYTAHKRDRGGTYSVSLLKRGFKTTHGKEFTQRRTLVGCLGVPEGNIIVRQGGFCFITGNCPGDNLQPYVLDYKSKSGNVDWGKGEDNNCEDALIEMRESRNKWKRQCSELEESKNKELAAQLAQIELLQKRGAVLTAENEGLSQVNVTQKERIKALEGKIEPLEVRLNDISKAFDQILIENKELHKKANGNLFSYTKKERFLSLFK